MPQAQVTMDVRKVNDKVSVIDVKGEFSYLHTAAKNPPTNFADTSIHRSHS